MKAYHYIILTVAAAVLSLFLFGRSALCTGFFPLFTNTQYSAEGLAAVEAFNPDSDSFYLPPLEGKSFFESVNDLSIIRRADVRKYLYIYLTQDRSWVIESIERSQKYMPVIEAVYKRYPDLPRELLLLPLLESGFEPCAVSRSQATGLWQFVSNTSSPLGLKNNEYVDERRDIEKSTEAALRHLDSLYRSFGSWEKALAAYNGGAGYVRRTTSAYPGKSFWSIVDAGGFRPETNEYASRYAALMLIYKNQYLLGIHDEIHRETKHQIATVVFETPVKISVLSSVTGVSEQTLHEYNTELKGNSTPPYAQKYKLRVPTDMKKAVLNYAKDPVWQM